MTLVFQLTPDISFFFEVILPVAKGSTLGRHGGSILRATSNEVGLRTMILQLASHKTSHGFISAVGGVCTSMVMGSWTT